MFVVFEAACPCCNRKRFFLAVICEGIAKCFVCSTKMPLEINPANLPTSTEDLSEPEE